MGFMVWWLCFIVYSKGLGLEKFIECRFMTIIFMVTIWFYGIDILIVCDWNGCRVNFRVIELFLLIRMLNLLIILEICLCGDGRMS